MKKTWMVFCIVAVLAIAACAIQQSPSPNDRESIVVNQQNMPKGQSPAAAADDAMALLSKHNAKVQSVYYKYRGPQTADDFYEFYVKDNRIKYLPALKIKSLDREDSYDTIYIDSIGLTAKSYCSSRQCVYPGKKANLNYNDNYINTIFDWLNNINQAKKIGEEVIDDRNTWKIETNKGTFWVETFYGLPLKIDSNGRVFKFEQIAVNGVTSQDVVPNS